MKRLALVVLALILLGSMASGAAAQAPTTVYLGQSPLSLTQGQEVDVPIMVTNAQNWYGVDVRLAYDPAVVQTVNVTRGVIPQPNFVVWERFDNAIGMAYYVITQLNPTLPASGDGLLATVRLKALTTGQTPLVLTVSVSDRYGNILPVLALSGQLAVGVPMATATTLPTSTPTVVPTATPVPMPTRCSGILWKGRCISLF